MTLRAEGVGHRYPGRSEPALDQVDLELKPASFTALLGPNGSGKSTLLGILAGLLRPTSGRAILDGEDVAKTPRAVLAQRMAYLPAKPHMPYGYTARELVLMGRHPFGRGALLETPADVALADGALERTFAAPFAERSSDALSSGERQRVFLARVLCQGVSGILLDEPTSAQDAAHALDLFGLFGSLAREERTVVVATHDLNTAARHADRLVVLAKGRVVADGAPADVVTSELLAEVFEVDALQGSDDGVPYAVPRART